MRDERQLGWAIVARARDRGGALDPGPGRRGRLEAVFTTGLIAAMLRFATPLAFAAIGGIINERAGVVNIGLEGMMLAGAFFGIWATVWSGSWQVGLLMAMVFGGAVRARPRVLLDPPARRPDRDRHRDQLPRARPDRVPVPRHLRHAGTPSDISRIPTVHLAFIEDIPFIGDIFGNLSLMIWLMFALSIISWVVIFQTPIGLRLRAVGEHPRAADTVGISVYGVRYVAVIVSGMLAALGGAYLSIGFTGTFNENMSAGRGFIALAAVIFGKWNPFGAFGACLLFGFASALSIPLQREADISANLLSTLPYVLTLVALVGVIGRSVGPAAVGRPYTKG